MAKLITTEQLAKLLENEYGGVINASKVISVGWSSYILDYDDGLVTVDDGAGNMDCMPMSEFKTDEAGARWIVNSIAELSSTEVGMAVDYIISKENSNEQE